ncbi:MAG TPA: hypothetical protein VIE91_02040 [Methylophilaceae bacterium]|jgi:hypothetical protein
MSHDTQVTELMGRNYLINQLLAAGIEVAVPVRDHGVDLVAYLDVETIAEGYSARPIQIKASSAQAFSIDKKYARFPHLILAYIWNLRSSEKVVIYGLDYEDALSVAKKMGYLETKSWAKGKYTTTAPSAKLKKLLQPYEMNEKKWAATLKEF